VNPGLDHGVRVADVYCGLPTIHSGQKQAGPATTACLRRGSPPRPGRSSPDCRRDRGRRGRRGVAVGL